MICQVGIAAVRNGVIVDEVNMLVQPPYNQYDDNVKSRHFIREIDTFDKPTFDKVWQDIKVFFVDQKVVAHSDFDYSALKNTLNFYNITIDGINRFVNTCRLNGGKRLEVCCEEYGISCEHHHDALNDAICCAKLYIANCLDGKDSENISNLKEKCREKKKRKRIDEIYTKDLEHANPDSPLYNRKVVITGTFRQSRDELKRFIKSLGADIDTSISKNTNVIIVGQDYGPKKKERWENLQMNGYNIRLLYQDDIDLILAGEWDKYRDISGGFKDLDFTINIYKKNKIDLSGHQNNIYNKVLYWSEGYRGSIELISQMAGNLGASGDNYIYKDTDVCILSDKTIELLENGDKDDTIKYIERTYNEAKSVVFNFKFISESDFLDYVKRRCDAIGDDITRYYYDKYIESIGK